MFALECIARNSYICEYKTTKVLTNSEAEIAENEYQLNNEACCLLRGKVKDKNMWFDATRRINQYRRFINHSITYNIKPMPPGFICGKWRVGFLATQDINKGEELLYDYGVRDAG